MLALPRFVFALALATALLMTGTPVAVLIGGIVGQSLSGSPSLATLPLAAMVCGLALFAIPASKILTRYGYKTLFATGTGLAIASNMSALVALQTNSFSLWIISMTLTGTCSACAQQLRFCVSHYISSSQISVALSVFMLAGALAAILGPEVATRSAFTNLAPFSDAYIVLTFLQIAALIFLLMLTPPERSPSTIASPSNETNNKALLAIAASVTAYGVMSFVMTATPISMHSQYGHSLTETKMVIQWHILAMFLPSLITGKVIQKAGVNISILLGLICFILTFVFTLQGVAFLHFSAGLIFLGLGWNILFTTGSTLAAQHHNQNFCGKHDTWVFSVQAIASLGAGAALFKLGWVSLQWVALLCTLPLLVLVFYQWLKTDKNAALSVDRTD